MNHNTSPKLPSLESVLAKPSAVDSVELPSLTQAFAEPSPADAPQLPSLRQALAADGATDAVPNDSREQRTQNLDIEFNPNALVAMDLEQIGRIEAMIDTMQDAQEQPRAIEFAIYRELESMGVDLSTVRGDAVVIEAVFASGKREPRAMSITPQEFGTMLRQVNLHEIAEVSNEYAANQEELLEMLGDEISSRSKELTRTIDSESTELPPAMISKFKDTAEQLLLNLQRGQLDPHQLNEFMMMTRDVRGKYLAEQKLRYDRERAVNPDTLTEDIARKASDEFDDEHVGLARRSVSVFNDKLLDLKQRLHGATQVSQHMTTQLTRIGSEIDEILTDRNGHDQHRHTLMSLLRGLETQFDDERKSKIHVQDAVDQLR